MEVADTLAENSSASLGSIGSTQRCEIPAFSPARARSRIASRDLGGKPLDLPAWTLARIKKPVVQPVGAALPELDPLGNDAVPAPVGRAWRRVAIAAARLVHLPLERFPRSHHFALLGCRRRKACAEGPRGEIVIGFAGADFFHRAFDAH